MRQARPQRALTWQKTPAVPHLVCAGSNRTRRSGTTIPVPAARILESYHGPESHRAGRSRADQMRVPARRLCPYPLGAVPPAPQECATDPAARPAAPERGNGPQPGRRARRFARADLEARPVRQRPGHAQGLLARPRSCKARATRASRLANRASRRSARMLSATSSSRPTQTSSMPCTPLPSCA